jgi:hypothetical protein
MRTIQDAHFQAKTALAFVEMTGNAERYSERERKGFFRMAFMHAKVAATMAACLDDIKLEFMANGIASDCAYALDAMLEDGASIDGARMAYFNAGVSRAGMDKMFGLSHLTKIDLK